jgi:hypothetical protein
MASDVKNIQIVDLSQEAATSGLSRTGATTDG